MATFDSLKLSPSELLKDITTGNIQLPAYQRGGGWGANGVPRAMQLP